MHGFQHLGAGVAALGRLLASEPVPFAARVALAVVLLSAGGYKLRSPLAAATSAVSFRVAARPSKPLGYALGVVESSIAVLLLLPWPALAVAGCALGGLLSLVFTFLIGRALHAGHRFPCNCLPGDRADLSVTTAARAIAMSAAAAVGAVGPLGHGVVVPTPALAVSGVGLAAAFLGLPLGVHGLFVAWRRYRAYVAAVDWEWVTAVHAGLTQPDLANHRPPEA